VKERDTRKGGSKCSSEDCPSALKKVCGYLVEYDASCLSRSSLFPSLSPVTEAKLPYGLGEEPKSVSEPVTVGDPPVNGF